MFSFIPYSLFYLLLDANVRKLPETHVEILKKLKQVRNADTKSFNVTLRDLSRAIKQSRRKGWTDAREGLDMTLRYLDALNTMTYSSRHAHARPDHITYTTIFNGLATEMTQNTTSEALTSDVLVKVLAAIESMGARLEDRHIYVYCCHKLVVSNCHLYI